VIFDEKIAWNWEEKSNSLCGGASAVPNIYSVQYLEDTVDGPTKRS